MNASSDSHAHASSDQPEEQLKETPAVTEGDTVSPETEAASEVAATETSEAAETSLAPEVADSTESSEPVAESSEAPESAEQAERAEVKKDAKAAKGKDKKERELDSAFATFAATLEELEGPEAKLEKLLEFMQAALAGDEKPNFKGFWDAKRACLPLFKEATDGTDRARLWQVYTHLGNEAKSLKDRLDEESQFAVEQLEAAITALESGVQTLEAELAQLPELELQVECSTVADHWEDYSAIQKKINLLNQHAARVNSLRKELMATGMRIRVKNQFFQRLSKAGDGVFPPRKDLVKEVSDLFAQDVAGFVSSHFQYDTPRGPLHQLREEIKALQAVAKGLTLNTRTFNDTRRSLSECWDKVRGLEKERRKVRLEKKEVFVENQKQIEELIQAVTDKISSEELAPSQAAREFDNILQEMRQVELGREEVKSLKDKIAEARKPVEEILEKEAAERKAREAERQAKIREQVTALEAKIVSLFEEAEQKSIEDLESSRDALTGEISELTLPRQEKQKLEKQLKPMRDVLLEKREKAILSLSQDDQDALDQLRKLLADRQARRRECKQKMEVLRKEKGTSGFDFEKAMELETRLEEEKSALQKCDEGIREIEQKVKELEGKIS